MINGRIEDEKINQIREAVDIVDLIGEYVQLKKQGRNYFGLCPFHGENSPSFSVSAEKQIFHCFGCGAGGNIFTFLMDIEGYNFVESAKVLAEKEMFLWMLKLIRIPSVLTCLQALSKWLKPMTCCESFIIISSLTRRRARMLSNIYLNVGSLKRR